MMLDCFPFFNELDLLELRLRELDGVVDQWILVQSRETHSGLPKPLSFSRDDPRWDPWRDRIRTFEVPLFPTTADRWVRENAPRHLITEILAEYAPSDIAIISDVDEIPDPRQLVHLIPELTDERWAGFRVPTFYYALNLNTRRPYDCIAVARVSTVRRLGAQTLRDLRKTPPIGPIPGGWHFSWQGDLARIRQKLVSFAHAEYDKPPYTDPLWIRDRVERGEDLFHPWKNRFQLTPLHDLPRDVQRRPAAYAHMLRDGLR